MGIAHRSLRRLLPAALVPPLVAVALVYAVGHAGARSAWSSCVRGGHDGGQQVSCLGNRLRTVAGQRGDAAALRDIEAAAHGNPRIAQDCHLASHALGEPRGRAAAARGASFPADLHGGSACRDGYVHGYLIGYLDRAPLDAALVRAVDVGCAGARDARDELNCVHAFGHAAARKAGASAHGVARASRRCGEVAPAGGPGVPAVRLQFECRYGMWMEYTLRDLRSARPVAVRNCAGAPPAAATACWSFLPGRVVQLTGSAASARRSCSSAPDAEASAACRRAAKDIA